MGRLTKAQIGAMVALVVIIACLVAVYFFHAPKASPSVSNGIGKVGVYMSYYPVGLLYSTALSTSSTPTLYAVPHAPNKLVLGMAGDASTTYYLILGADQLHSDLFMSHASDPNQPLLQLTHSQTLKANLTYDPGSHMVAYQSVPLAKNTNMFSTLPWEVTLYNTYTNKEVALQSGTKPLLIAGGQYIYYLATSTVNVTGINAHSASKVVLQNARFNTAYAFDPKTYMLALYNPTSQSINYFDMHGVDTAKYLSSESVAFYPTSILIDGNTTLIAGPIKGDLKHFLIQTIRGNTVSTPIQLATPQPGLIPQNLTLLSSSS